MSIVPINDGGGSDSSWSRDLWDPMDRVFSDFPFPFPFSSSISNFMPDLGLGLGFGSRVNTHLDWRETSRAHVWKIALPGFVDEDVLVQLEDDRMLQVSLESGNFMTRFKIPDNADLQNLKATMNYGVLVVTAPKYNNNESGNRNFRVIEIEGSD